MKKGTTEITYMNWGCTSTMVMKNLDYLDSLEFAQRMVTKFGGSFSYKLI